MALTPEQVRSLEVGDFVRICDNVHGYNRHRTNRPPWMRYLGLDWCVEHIERRYNGAEAVLTLEGVENKFHTEYIAAIVGRSGACQFSPSDADISLLVGV
jgi:hypothetical protein